MIKVDDNGTMITGSKVDILGDISQLFKALNEMPGFTEEEVRHAVDVGFWSEEKLEKECTKMAHEAAEVCGLDAHVVKAVAEARCFGELFDALSKL